MARIKAIDMRLLEEVFASRTNGRGYVLDFSDRTFAEFFREIEVDIGDEKHLQNGTSKLNRLRTFVQIERESFVGQALRAFWEYRDAVYGPFDQKDEKIRQQETRFLQLVHAMDGKGVPVRKEARNPAPCAASPSAQALAELNGRLLTLTTMKAQERGFAFERFLLDLFALYDLDPRRSFRNIGEQTDGSFELPPDTFLVEAKWQDAKIGQADLLILSGKVDGKAEWSRGLFISYSGFSDDGLRAFASGRRTGIICMDGLDLAQILSGGLSLIDVIQRKKRRAAETGSAFVPVRDLFSSVT